MRYRHNGLWNKKHADRIHKPYRAHIYARRRHDVLHACPLCGLEDGAGHMLGGCEHRDIKGLIIERHNDAVRLLAQEIRNSDRFRDAALVMDCKESDRESVLAIGTRVPNWIYEGVPEEHKDRLRPDLVLFEGITADQLRQGCLDTLKTRTTIHVVEIGYGPDTRLLELRQRKLEQHMELIQALRNSGWTVSNPHPILLGAGGSIGITASTFLTHILGLPASRSDGIKRKLIGIAAKRAVQMVGTRRALEYGRGSATCLCCTGNAKGRHTGASVGSKQRGPKKPG